MALCFTEKLAGAPYARETPGAIEIGGKKLNYTALAEDTILPGGDGGDMCAIFSVSYLARGLNRPVMFIFNGGPGSPSAWLHMGFLGPRLAQTDARGMPPAQGPYALRDNPDCLLDVCDMVFYDPPGAGYSRVFDEKYAPECFGDHADADVAAAFIRAWLKRHDKAGCPIYILGESFGSTRASLLAYRLRDLRLDAVLHVGPGYTGKDLIPRTLKDLVPAAATRWYFDESADKPPLSAVVARAREFLESEYVPALYRGQLLSAADRRHIAQKLAELTGLQAEYYMGNGLKVVREDFRNMLLYGRGLKVGSFDARFTLPLCDAADPMLKRFEPFISAGAQLRFEGELGIDCGRAYRENSFDATDAFGWPFDAEPDMQGYGGVFARQGMSVAEAAAAAWRARPSVRFFFATGYFDTVATVENTRFGVAHTDVPLANVVMKEYESGHAVYADDRSRRALAADVREFLSAGGNADA